MENYFYSVEMPFSVEFYDVDTMGVVWHGNYVKFMESVRCVLLEKLGYGYKEMAKDGFAFPIVSMNLKYVKSLVFGEKAIIKAYLLEYINKVRIKYELLNSKGEVVTKAETTQFAMAWNTRETLFESPDVFIKKVEENIKKVKK